MADDAPAKQVAQPTAADAVSPQTQSTQPQVPARATPQSGAAGTGSEVREQNAVGKARPRDDEADEDAGVEPDEDTAERLRARCAQHQLPPRLPIPRFNGAAVAAPNGTIYLVGGATEFSTAEKQGALVLYDPADRSYRQLPSAPVGFKGIPAAAFAAGKLFVLDEAFWEFDPHSNRWRQPSQAPEVILNRAVATWRDGRVYFFGGLRLQSNGPLNRSDVYDPATDTWTMLAPMSFGDDGIAAAVSGDRIYVLGPAGAAYDPARDQWTSLPPSPDPRYWGSTVSFANGRLMSIGGSRPGIIGLTDVVEIYDPNSMSWSSGPALPEQVYGPTVVACSGDVLMFGGDSAGSIVDRVYGLSSQGTWNVSP